MFSFFWWRLPVEVETSTYEKFLVVFDELPWKYFQPDESIRRYMMCYIKSLHITVRGARLRVSTSVEYCNVLWYHVLEYYTS